MKPLIIVQARMGSSRLPCKVLKPIVNRPMLVCLIERLKHVRLADRVVVATSISELDKPIRALCQQLSLDCFAGHETDVLDRFYHAAIQYDADSIVRVTGDCPLVDPSLVDQVIDRYQTTAFDHVGLATGAGVCHLSQGRFPDGLDVECFSFNALNIAWQEATHFSDREHVTPYIWRNSRRFRTSTLFSDRDYGMHRWTVDYPEDLEMIRIIYNALYHPGKVFHMAEILSFLEENPAVATLNRRHIGHENYQAVALTAMNTMEGDE